MTDTNNNNNKSRPYGGCLLYAIKDENGKDIEAIDANLSKFDNSFPQIQICRNIKDNRDDGSVHEIKSYHDVTLGSITDLRTLIDRYFELRSSHVLQFKGKQ